ncbi:MAG: hypothetical protein ACRENP_24620 [Longimicrobiales bacterium]
MARFLVVVGMMLIAACSSTTESEDWRRVVGQMEPAFSSVQAVQAPSEAVVNAPFVVTVNTLGSSSCTRADGAVASVAGRTALITPYDLVAPSGTSCTRDLRSFPRSVSLRLTSVGDGLIRVQARGFDDRSLTFDITIPVRAAN